MPAQEGFRPPRPIRGAGVAFQPWGLFMFGIGIQELLLVTLIVVVVFGAGRLPQIGDGMGRMITNFRKSVKGEQPEPKDEPKEANKIQGA
jgi:sec-independent protein translocase protein TatA